MQSVLGTPGPRIFTMSTPSMTFRPSTAPMVRLAGRIWAQETCCKVRARLHRCASAALLILCLSSALVNYTSQVATLQGAERDIALRFLTHYMGDAHQPLHLTGRARGGNDISVRFEGRYAKLHTVWDSLLINSQVRQLANYTTRLPSARIESALLGKPYDAYIRWILAEGLGQANGDDGRPSWWADEEPQWTSCPDRRAATATGKISTSSPAHWLRAVTPQSAKLAQRIYSTTFSSVPSEADGAQWKPDDVDETELPICPYAWTKPMHPLVCSYAFASPVPPPDQEHTIPLAELDVPDYRGRIDADKVMQKQLAKAGMRLAAVLNTLLLPEAQRAGEDEQTATTFSHVHASKRSKRHGSSQSPILGLVKVTAASIAEVIILSSVGYILARQGVLDKKTQTKINRLNVSFFTPALLFSKVAFTLNPARLAELIIVPAGFVIITLVSTVAAFLLSWSANLSKSQRNFSIACAITPNSNSLPVALMQSLVVTVPQLHWEEEGEPEDTANGMLGRSLTYLVLFSTLGMFLRWSIASQLLSTMEEGDEEEPEEEVRTARLIDYDDDEQRDPVSHTTPVRANGAGNPVINIRRSTEDGGGTDSVAPATLTAETLPEGPAGRRPSRSRQGPPAWARSFPNSPDDSESSSSADESERRASQRSGAGTRSCASVSKRVYQVAIKTPFVAVTRFMTMPLYAAVISLVVALIPPLQRVVASVEPVVGALETAGACSIPLTMVVLGAYFYQEAEVPAAQTAVEGPQEQGQWQVNSSASTLVGNGTASKRKSLPWMRNPWNRSGDSSEAGSEADAVQDESRHGSREEEGEGGAAHSLARQNARINSVSSGSWFLSMQRSSPLSAVERMRKKQIAMERRTIAVAVGSRMVLTPLVLMPLLAWYAIATRENVMDDPVFITCACLLVGSPPALTLAQITSQSAKGSNSSFERLISKTIFVSYAILAAPTTILLVLAALLIAENDH